MPDIEHKIIEIISKDFDCCEAECGYCDKLKECSQFTAERIVNLIAQHESALRSENEALKQQGKAMAEALRIGQEYVQRLYDSIKFSTEARDIVGKDLAKIDAVLPKGEGKCAD